MIIQPLPSGFPYILGKFCFLFLSVHPPHFLCPIISIRTVCYLQCIRGKKSLSASILVADELELSLVGLLVHSQITYGKDVYVRLQIP
jgi:hypothetical protein